MASKAYPTTTFKNFFFNLPAAGAAGPIVKASARPPPRPHSQPTAYGAHPPQPSARASDRSQHGTAAQALAPARSAKKFVLLGSKYQDELFAHVDPSQLPRKLGGELDDGLQWAAEDKGKKKKK